jgi:hypothetical protein
MVNGAGVDSFMARSFFVDVIFNILCACGTPGMGTARIPSGNTTHGLPLIATRSPTPNVI